MSTSANELLKESILRLTGTRCHKQSFDSAISIWYALLEVLQSDAAATMPHEIRVVLLELALASGCFLSVTLPKDISAPLPKLLRKRPFVEACVAVRVAEMLLSLLPVTASTAADEADAITETAETTAYDLSWLQRLPLVKARRGQSTGSLREQADRWLRRPIRDARARFAALCLMVFLFCLLFCCIIYSDLVSLVALSRS